MMNDGILAEAVDAVNELNDRMCLEGKNEENGFVLHYTQFWMAVDFCGVQIWDTEEDQRFFYEAANEWEPLKVCWVRLLKERLESMISSASAL